MMNSEDKKFTGLDFRKVSKSLSLLAPEVVQYLYPEGFEEANHWCLGDATGRKAKRNGSFRIALSGPKAGMCKDFSTSEKAFDLLTAWSIAKSCTIKEAAMEAQKVFDLTPKGDLRVKSKKELSERIESAKRSLARSAGGKGWVEKPYDDTETKLAMQRLQENPKALAYLINERGLSQKTITTFRLGLTSPFANKETGVVSQDALVLPVIDKAGEFTGKRMYYKIADVTINPTADNGWGKRPVKLYWSPHNVGANALFICEGMKDVWAHTQNLLEIPQLSKSVRVASSTHGTSIPDEYNSTDFWKSFKHILVGTDNDDAGNELAQKIANLAFHHASVKVRRVCPTKEPKIKDWTDFWKHKNQSDFMAILSQAPFIKPEEVQMP